MHDSTYYYKVCVPNKTEDLNLNVLNMVIGINESKALKKHISCKCKCKFHGRKCDLDRKWNNDKCRCECKNIKKHCVCKKYYIWNPATCSYKNGKYLASIIDDSVNACDKIIEETKTVTTNFDEKNAICKTEKLHLLLVFLSITIALLIAVSIYCYLIKYKSKQKHLLPYYVTNEKLKRVLY